MLTFGLNGACVKRPTAPVGRNVEDCIRNNSFTLKQTYHVVSRGENLYRISLAYGVSLEEVARTNGIGDPSLISVGQRIIIPNHAASSGLIWPLRGRISSLFGLRRGRPHTGVDIAAPEGTPIRAAADGLVVVSGSNLDGYLRYGKIVVIQHGNGVQTLYAHNRENFKKAGECVRAGDGIAAVGASGNATGYHLHFEIREDGKPVNPLNYLP